MRLDRILANSGYGTRSAVRDMIRDGRVCFSGTIIRDPAYNIDESQTGNIRIDETQAKTSQYIYLCMNKPENYLTAMQDKRLATIGDLISIEYVYKGVSPVGRLDYNTTGVLLLTNNGTLSHRLTSPKWHIEKKYLVSYSGPQLSPDICASFAAGITLREDNHEPVKLSPAKLELLENNTCRLTLTEGKSHQVKRMLAAYGRSVTALHRESIGCISLLPDQKTGSMRILDEDEINNLLREVNLGDTTK